MNDLRGPTPYWSLWSENDETRYPPYVRMPSQGNVMIAPTQDPGAMQGHAWIRSSASATLT